MTGYCIAGQMYVELPCPAKACPSYEKCLAEYKRSGVDEQRGKEQTVQEGY